MIIHSQVFETKYRTSMAEYTLSYQTNQELDYDFCKAKCWKLLNDIDEFDGKLHQMDSNETKRLIYFWKYVKKNLILFSVVDHVQGIYEDQCIERFEQFHK